MVRTTLIELVTKTEQTGATPVVLADRIGLGFAEAVERDPATSLSRGHFPMPQLPTSMPATSNGSFSGDKACRCSYPRANRGYRSAFQASRKPAVVSRTRFPGLSLSSFRLDSDCQSLGRNERRQESREVSSNANSNWQRKYGSTPATAN